MSNKLPLVLGVAGALSAGLAAAPPDTSPARLRYSRLPDLPPQPSRPNLGVAGAFAGVSHGVLLVAGGANFPNGYPWQNGTKVWQPTVYALAKKGKHREWQPADALEKPVAYGASVVWKNQLIGIGGNDARQRYATVFTLAWDATAGRVQTGALPALPLALANQAAAVLGDRVYVFGGESDRGTEKSLYVLNLKNPAAGWQKRADLPGPARAFTVLVAHEGGLYVLGGRETVAGKTTVFRDAYVYQPKLDSWSALPDLPVPLAAHSAASGGPHSLLIFGGDDGVRLGQIEELNRQLGALAEGAAKAELTQQRNTLQSDHPGFRREIWEYRTDSRAWAVIDTLPFPTPVTTPVVRWGRHFILPSGEVSPGVRTPTVRQITISNSH